MGLWSSCLRVASRGNSLFALQVIERAQVQHVGEYRVEPIEAVAFKGDQGGYFAVSVNLGGKSGYSGGTAATPIFP
ncbi:unnamed protein product [Sphagnum balticum]